MRTSSGCSRWEDAEQQLYIPGVCGAVRLRLWMREAMGQTVQLVTVVSRHSMSILFLVCTQRSIPRGQRYTTPVLTNLPGDLRYLLNVTAPVESSASCC